MRLLIQIPCFNEETTLSEVIKCLPESIPGIIEIKIQVINDGSTDGTVDVARALGVDHIIDLKGPNKKHLGTAFKAGVENALKLGFDILVNTDGDNQYPGVHIRELVEPILRGEAEICIGDRQPHRSVHFSRFKRYLQYAGNFVISSLCKKRSFDAVSGFRAFSKGALERLELNCRSSYTIETLMQAFRKNIPLVWIPITTNPPTRASRLIRNMALSTLRSALLILGLYFKYYILQGRDGPASGNLEDKDNLKDPVSKNLVSNFDLKLEKLIKNCKPGSIHEVGCGEGRHYPIFKESGAKKIIMSDRILPQGLVNNGPFFEKNIYQLKAPEDSAELVVCCEVLEHLEQPERALRLLRELKAADYIFSVPREPVWCFLNMLRFRYLRNLGNTPGHIQHWTGSSFLKLLEANGFKIIEELSPFPWIMVRCRTL